MSGCADRQSPADILIEGLGKIEDAHKIKVAFPYLPEPAVSILLRGLQAEGIKDVDAWLSQQAGCRDAAIRRLLAEGVTPPTNIPWKQFCDRVRDECNGWMGKGLRVRLRGASMIDLLKTLWGAQSTLKRYCLLGP
jgi:hypothetical protein